MSIIQTTTMIKNSHSPDNIIETYMKKQVFLILLLFIGFSVFAQTNKPQWTSILSDKPETFRTQLVSSSENSIRVNVQVPGFYATSVTTPRGEANIISVPKSVSTAQAGEPNVPMKGIPVMIGDKARMNMRVVDAQYMDFENIEVAPSKGDFPRTIDPATVPYTYGDCYNQDAFFPASNLDLYEPYIIRDFRGQNMAVFPFAYNPITKTLRVYYNMTVEMYKVDDKGSNVIETRRSNEVKLDSDFKSVYQRHFINYEASMSKYTPVDEEGDLLIICYDNFISSMTDFVNWKKTRGINTTIVGTSTISSSLTYSNLKTYIQNQYNANNNLTHVLLVGDVAQIPGYSYSGGGSSYSGLGDNAFGQIVGSDVYNDLFIGRFSAQTAAQVTTQVNRVITYERDLTTSATWLQNADGISKKEGGSGHNNEDDYQHMDNIRTDLLNYGYNNVYQDYSNLTGYTGTASSISSHINSGVGLVNYTNHGNTQLWGVASYSNVQVNALTNSNKLPFIWSVACLVGKYDNTETSYGSGTTIGQTNDCFAEAWMHATKSSSDLTPTGAIGALMSYISQPWIPPMWAHDECIDILCELKNNNIKHTWGGTSINGLFSIFDNYSTSEAAAVGTYQAWVLYGDPTLMLRTKTPQAMTITHTGSLPMGTSTYNVSVSNGNGATATITDANHNILGKATVNNGSATITVSGNLTPNQELTLCVFGYNKVTYLGTITVTGGTQYDITVNQPQHGTISVPVQAYGSSTVTLTATPETGYCLYSWTVTDANNNPVTVTNNQFTMPSSAVTVTATFVPGLKVSLASVMNGSIGTDMEYALQGNTINLTATPASNYVFDSWVVYKTGDVNTMVTVSNNSFTMPNYPVTVSAIFNEVVSGDVTIGSGTSTSQYIPTYNYYDYSLTQQIYTKAEVGEAGTITHIVFYVSANPSSRKIDIYMSHTSKNSFSSTSDWVTQNTSYRVVQNYQAFGQTGWNVIPLDTPFEYNGTNNLLVTIDDNTGSWSSSKISFYTYSTSANRAHYTYQDNTDFNPASISANSSYNKLLTSNNQVVFTKEVPSTEGYLSVSNTNLTGFSTMAGTASEAQSIAVIGSNLQANLTVSAPTGFELSSSQNGSYNSSLTLTPSNGNVRANVFVRLSASASEGEHNGNLTLTSSTTSATVSLNGEVLPATATQTVTLSQGWNWWVPTAGITLADLKAALGSNGVTISSQNAGFLQYANGVWTGTLENLVPGQMYKIQASTNCNITLTGTALSSVTITIHKGFTWFGFTGDNETNIAQALTGFTPAEGDMITSYHDGFTQYINGRWVGTLNKLTPGNGYVYYSNDNSNKEITFNK